MTAEFWGCTAGLPEVSMSRAPSPVIKDPGSPLPLTSVQALRPGGRLQVARHGRRTPCPWGWAPLRLWSCPRTTSQHPSVCHPGTHCATPEALHKLI